MKMEGMEGIDSDIKGWLADQFHGCVREGDEAPGQPKQKGKRVAIDSSALTSSDLFSWDFSPDTCSEEELLAICFRIFEEAKVIEQLHLSKATVENFLQAVRDRHKGNPYHCWKVR
jgi:hypothetical protein